jgi:DNA-binding response OmpR family regulator
VAEQERKDRIMVITGSDDERDMLVESTLGPLGYAVQSAGDGGTGLAMALEKDNRPDVIILDLDLEGLKGQDVMAALNAQAVDVPIIAIANRGQERALLDAFRLGAKDYIMRPLREAEMVQVVERALKEVRISREREQLIEEVRTAAQEAERHLRELKMLMGVGRSVTATVQPKEVFERVMRAALQMTRADTAGLFSLDPATGDMIVEAGHNMSRNLIENLGHPITDDLASLVMNSQEAYLGMGEGLQKFRPAQQGVAAVIYAPMVFQDKPIGVLWVSNAKLGFDAYLRDIMSALADYAAIAVSNARLFQEMEARAQNYDVSADQMETQQTSRSALYEAEASASPQASGVLREIRRPLTELLGNMNLFRTGEMGQIAAGQQAAVDVMHRQLDSLVRRIDQLVPPDSEA